MTEDVYILPQETSKRRNYLPLYLAIIINFSNVRTILIQYQIESFTADIDPYESSMCFLNANTCKRTAGHRQHL